MNVDLLQHADKWKATLKELRERFAQFERMHSKAGVQAWRLHWDYRPGTPDPASFTGFLHRLSRVWGVSIEACRRCPTLLIWCNYDSHWKSNPPPPQQWREWKLKCTLPRNGSGKPSRRLFNGGKTIYAFFFGKEQIFQKMKHISCMCGIICFVTFTTQKPWFVNRKHHAEIFRTALDFSPHRGICYQNSCRQ